MDPDQVPGYFYPRSPCGERQVIGQVTIHSIHISIHALLAESDVAYSRLFTRTAYFYPRSPCGERRRNSQNIKRRHKISIHALLAESDDRSNANLRSHRRFLSTLSLRRATTSFIQPKNTPKFLSTLSLRRATTRTQSQSLSL